MECAKEMGCKASIVDFVMPLGTTVNMNGTALYEATTVIFLAQVCGLRETRDSPVPAMYYNAETLSLAAVCCASRLQHIRVGLLSAR